MSASWLFVPGTRPDRFAKAAASGAHEVIIDLEDAVDPAAKDDARRAAAEWLRHGGTAWVRINGVGTPWHDADVAAVVDHARGIVLPKAETPVSLPAPILALVETAAGVVNASELARTVSRLAFGSIDYALDIEASECDEALLLARSTLVLTSRAAGLPGPIDGVTRSTSDGDAVAADAARARGLGFAGKLCIHPRQVATVNAAFVPTAAEVDWARRVLQHATAGVSTVDGVMVDRPVIERAGRIVARERQAHATA